MTQRDWNEGEPVLGLFLNGDAIPTPGPRGEEVDDDSFLLLFNAHSEEREFTLPRPRLGSQWELELSTVDPAAAPGSSRHAAQEQLSLPPHSLLVLKRVQ
jgi:glycogen operon protein